MIARYTNPEHSLDFSIEPDELPIAVTRDNAAARRRIDENQEADRKATAFNRYQNWAVDKLGGKNITFACALGIAGEAGEAADIVKKHLCHGKPFDAACRSKLLLELGDVLFYVATLGAQYGLSLREIVEANEEKLDARYPTGFSTAESIQRKDELPTVVGPWGRPYP